LPAKKNIKDYRKEIDDLYEAMSKVRKRMMETLKQSVSEFKQSKILFNKLGKGWVRQWTKDISAPYHKTLIKEAKYVVNKNLKKLEAVHISESKRIKKNMHRKFPGMKTAESVSKKFNKLEESYEEQTRNRLTKKVGILKRIGVLEKELQKSYIMEDYNKIKESGIKKQIQKLPMSKTLYDPELTPEMIANFPGTITPQTESLEKTKATVSKVIKTKEDFAFDKMAEKAHKSLEPPDWLQELQSTIGDPDWLKDLLKIAESVFNPELIKPKQKPLMGEPGGAHGPLTLEEIMRRHEGKAGYQDEPGYIKGPIAPMYGQQLYNPLAKNQTTQYMDLIAQKEEAKRANLQFKLDKAKPGIDKSQKRANLFGAMNMRGMQSLFQFAVQMKDPRIPKAAKGFGIFLKGFKGVMKGIAGIGIGGLAFVGTTLGTLLGLFKAFQPILQLVGTLFGALGKVFNAQLAPIMTQLVEAIFTEEFMGIIASFGQIFFDLFSLFTDSEEGTKSILDHLMEFLGMFMEIFSVALGKLIDSGILTLLMEAIMSLFTAMLPLIDPFMDLVFIIVKVVIALMPLVEMLMPMLVWGIQMVGNIIIIVANIFIFVINAVIRAINLFRPFNPLPLLNYVSMGGMGGGGGTPSPAGTASTTSTPRPAGGQYSEMAEGGIVWSAGNYRLAESGKPEVVTSLEDYKSSQSNDIHVHFHGPVYGSPKKLQSDIQESIWRVS